MSDSFLLAFHSMLYYSLLCYILTLARSASNTVLLSKRPRCIWVQLLRFLFGAVQAMLIWCLLIAVPTIDSFYLIWLCPNWGSIVFSLWLGATFTVLGWFRARFERDTFAGVTGIPGRYPRPVVYTFPGLRGVPVAQYFLES